MVSIGEDVFPIESRSAIICKIWENVSITNAKKQLREASRKFQLINTSNLSNIYSRGLQSFRMVVYDVSSIVSKNRKISNGKLLPSSECWEEFVGIYFMFVYICIYRLFT